MKFCWHTRKFSIALLAWAPACITSEPTIQPVSLKVELPSSADESKSTKSAENLSINMSPTEKIKKLEAFIAKDSQNEKLTRDIRIMLAAEEAQVNGFIEVAEAKWLEATLIARRSFAQHAFERWVDQMLANAAQAPQLDMFAELILLKTESGKANDYMVSKPLRNKSQLKEWLLNRYKGRLISEEAPSIAEKISGISPKSDGPPLNDSLLLSTASDYCRSLDATDKAWMDWQNSLGFQLKSYFNALVQKCMGETTKALASFSAIYPTLEKNPKYGQYALQTSKEIIQLSRTQGDRGLMADTYLNLAKLWERKEFNEEALNLSGLDLDLMKIDDFLWAARYRAMVGDYENAKIYTQKSLDLNAAAFAKHNLRSRNREKEKLTLLRLEAFQLLAFRIAIETRDYDAALSYFEVAERIEGLKDTALMDILWHKGLTFYLKNEVKLAFDVWKSTAQRFKGKMESSYEARSLFWLARSAKELGYSESSSYANELIEKYALNYYAVIALNYSQIEGKWDRDLLDHEAMVAQLQNPSKLDINELRSRSTIGELLMRAEVTINLGLETYDKLAVADFAKELTSSYALSRVPHSYIYLTRLYNATNILLKSISLNTELAATFGEYWKKWPEQAYVYFPQPHLEVFRRNAHETVSMQNYL
jgi:hypothetical protein